MSTKPVEYAVVVDEFVSMNENQLTLMRGEIVKITARLGDWATGILCDKEGIFPLSCVDILHGWNPVECRKKHEQNGSPEVDFDYLSISSIKGSKKYLNYPIPPKESGISMQLKNPSKVQATNPFVSTLSRNVNSHNNNPFDILTSDFFDVDATVRNDLPENQQPVQQLIPESTQQASDINQNLKSVDFDKETALSNLNWTFLGSPEVDFDDLSISSIKGSKKYPNCPIPPESTQQTSDINQNLKSVDFDKETALSNLNLKQESELMDLNDEDFLYHSIDDLAILDDDDLNADDPNSYMVLQRFETIERLLEHDNISSDFEQNNSELRKVSEDDQGRRSLDSVDIEALQSVLKQIKLLYTTKTAIMAAGIDSQACSGQCPLSACEEQLEEAMTKFQKIRSALLETKSEDKESEDSLLLDKVVDDYVAFLADQRKIRSDLDSIKNLRVEDAVCNEIINTEQKYLNQLTIVLSVIGDNAGPYLSEEEQEAIFSGLRRVKEFTEPFLIDLRSSRHIGQVFAAHMSSMMTVYLQYSRGYDAAYMNYCKALKRQLTRTFFNDGFAVVVEQHTLLNMDTILIRPIQRLLHYPLLLERMLKVKDERNEDRECVESALQSLKELSTEINTYRRRRDLVDKYLRPRGSITSRMSGLNIHSLNKKAARLHERSLIRVGIHNQIVDRTFEEEERKFRKLKFSIINFCKLVSKLKSSTKHAYIRCRDLFDPSPISTTADFQNVFNHIAAMNDSFESMCDAVEKKVVRPVNMARELLRAPSLLIRKRLDKLLDYDLLLSDKKSIASGQHDSRLEVACIDYKSINDQLCADLPVVCENCTVLLNHAVAEVAAIQGDFAGEIQSHLLNIKKAFTKGHHRNGLTGISMIVSTLEVMSNLSICKTNSINSNIVTMSDSKASHDAHDECSQHKMNDSTNLIDLE